MRRLQECKVTCEMCGKTGMAQEDPLRENLILPDGWETISGKTWCKACLIMLMYEDSVDMMEGGVYDG